VCAGDSELRTSASSAVSITPAKCRSVDDDCVHDETPVSASNASAFRRAAMYAAISCSASYPSERKNSKTQASGADRHASLSSRDENETRSRKSTKNMTGKTISLK